MQLVLIFNLVRYTCILYFLTLTFLNFYAYNVCGLLSAWASSTLQYLSPVTKYCSQMCHTNTLCRTTDDSVCKNSLPVIFMFVDNPAFVKL